MLLFYERQKKTNELSPEEMVSRKFLKRILKKIISPEILQRTGFDTDLKILNLFVAAQPFHMDNLQGLQALSRERIWG